MIELSETSYINGFWFVSWADCNWMLCLYREPGAAWNIRYRFRYFADDRVFDSDDEWHWYSASAPSTEPEAQLEENLNVFARLISVARGAPLERLVVRGTVDDLHEKSRGSKWFHLASVGKATRA